MSIRKPSNRGQNIIGCFPSQKMRRMIPYESLIELDFIYMLDFDEEVTRFEAQPLKLPYQHNRKTKWYIPDFLVEHKQQPRSLVECKPQDKVYAEENQRKFAAARDWCARNHMEFRVVTDAELRSEYRLKNIKFLTRYAPHAVEPTVKSHIIETLKAIQAPVTVIELAHLLSSGDSSDGVINVFHMVFYHELFIPLDQHPIGIESFVYLPMATAKG